MTNTHNVGDLYINALDGIFVYWANSMLNIFNLQTLGVNNTNGISMTSLCVSDNKRTNGPKTVGFKPNENDDGDSDDYYGVSAIEDQNVRFINVYGHPRES